jgi:hypothetical protein
VTYARQDGLGGLVTPLILGRSARAPEARNRRSGCQVWGVCELRAGTRVAGVWSGCDLAVARC